MNEKLKEFVGKYKYGVGYDPDWIMNFAQAVADFAEKMVLEELKKELCSCQAEHSSGVDEDVLCDNCEYIDQRLAALGREKDGKD